MRNRNAIKAKIIAWGLLAAFLTAVLVYSVVVRPSPKDPANLFNFNFKRHEERAEVVKRHEFPAAEIKSVDIEWGSGSVYVLPSDGNKIVVLEKARGPWSESELFSVSVKDGEIKLKQKSGVRFFWFFRKFLYWEVSLPKKTYDKLKADFSSGMLSISDVEAESIEVKFTSGSSKGSGLKSKYLCLDMTSGTANISGSFSEIDGKCSSGLLKVSSDTAPSKLMLDLTSGNADISIPENDGFTLSQDKTSGLITSDFELDSSGRYKDGRAPYSIKVTSGTARLSRKR